MNSERRCEKHDMIIGTCSECDAPEIKRRHSQDELVLCYEPGNRANHRVHEPHCYSTEAQFGVDVEWPRVPITRQEAAGMIPCRNCNPSLPKATDDEEEEPWYWTEEMEEQAQAAERDASAGPIKVVGGGLPTLGKKR